MFLHVSNSSSCTALRKKGLMRFEGLAEEAFGIKRPNLCLGFCCLDERLSHSLNKPFPRHSCPMTHMH